MNTIDLIKKGYIPKELPPSFTTNTFCNNFISIVIELENNHKALDAILNTIKKDKELSPDEMSEKLVRTKKKFANRLAYSDAVHFNIPKVGLSRVSIRIPNPLHQGKLSAIIAKSFNDIQHIFNGSLMSISKPIIELESGEGKRSVKHEHYAVFKEKSILESFSYSMQLKTDIPKYYGSIYTHTIPWATFGGKDKYKKNMELHDSDPAKIKVIYGQDIDGCTYRLNYVPGLRLKSVPLCRWQM